MRTWTYFKVRELLISQVDGSAHGTELHLGQAGWQNRAELPAACATPPKTGVKRTVPAHTQASWACPRKLLLRTPCPP